MRLDWRFHVQLAETNMSFPIIGHIYFNARDRKYFIVQVWHTGKICFAEIFTDSKKGNPWRCLEVGWNQNLYCTRMRTDFYVQRSRTNIAFLTRILKLCKGKSVLYFELSMLLNLGAYAA